MGKVILFVSFCFLLFRFANYVFFLLGASVLGLKNKDDQIRLSLIGSFFLTTKLFSRIVLIFFLKNLKKKNIPL